LPPPGAQTARAWLGGRGFEARLAQGPAEPLYANFSRALNATGRPILFSLCEWGSEGVSAWGGKVRVAGVGEVELCTTFAAPARAQYGQQYRIQMDHIPFWNWGAYAAGTGEPAGRAVRSC
jgi:hypothetical protein